MLILNQSYRFSRDHHGTTSDFGKQIRVRLEKRHDVSLLFTVFLAAMVYKACWAVCEIAPVIYFQVIPFSLSTQLSQMEKKNPHDSLRL